MHFDRSNVVSFDYPASWNDVTIPMAFSFQVFITFLSTEPLLADPCGTKPGACLHSPLAPLANVLPPGGLLVTWAVNSPMGWTFDPTAGEPLVVGGVQSTIEELQSGCEIFGGATLIKLTVPWEEAPSQFTQMTACINGPFEGEVETQIKDMLASVKWLH